jgi:tripartite-type tricarboxylate transporter receptor subunit TctC
MPRLLLLVAVTIALALPSAAGAQTKFPSKAVKILVPYAPGGATDACARILAEQLKLIWGEAVVIENKVGASGIIALEELARSRPDGHTLMMGNVSTNALTPILLKSRMSIDFDRDIVTVARSCNAPVWFNTTTANDFPPKTLAEFIAYAKERPGQVRYSSAGIGSIQQVDTAVFEARTGIKMTHIPTRTGAAQMVRDLITGDTHMSWGNPAASRRYVEAGQMRPLAVVGDKRIPAFPDLPTMAELGFPEIGSIQWQTLLAPAGTPKDVQDAIFKGFTEALKAEVVLKAFERTSFMVPDQPSLADARAFGSNEVARYRKIIEELKITAEEQ